MGVRALFYRREQQPAQVEVRGIRNDEIAVGSTELGEHVYSSADSLVGERVSVVSWNATLAGYAQQVSRLSACTGTCKNKAQGLHLTLYVTYASVLLACASEAALPPGIPLLGLLRQIAFS